MINQPVTRRTALRVGIGGLPLFLIAGAQAVDAPRKGFFRVARKGNAWCFVTPEGESFFSTGVCCVGEGVSAKEYRADQPQYAAFQHYTDTSAWAKTAVNRLQKWGFNTVGGWSSEVLEKSGMPYTIALHLGSSSVPSVPWGDIFSPETERTMDAAGREQILAHRNDPNLIGWFTDNELGWWDETLFAYYLKQPESNATHRVLIKLLREHYANDFNRLRKDFDPGKATDFATLGEGTFRVTGGRASVVIDKFLFAFASEYYRLTHSIIRRYDPNHLILGDRYAGFYPVPVARAAAPYVDVISTNFGADWNNGAICHFYLDRLHRLTGKPVMITEYYLNAMENRSGNGNMEGVFPTVQTQEERAAAFGRNLRAFASLPYVIGAHWFQYTDEPTHGRTDGENCNMGLVDIADRPYEELTQTATALQRSIPRLRQQMSVQTGAPSPNQGVPPAPSRVSEGLIFWDTDASYVASGDRYPFGDLYLAWDATSLYVVVHTADFAEVSLYPDKKLPSSERTLFAIRSVDGKWFRFRFGPGGKGEAIEGTPAEYLCRTDNASTRFSLVCVLPAERFGKSSFRAGERFPLVASLTRHGAAEMMRWNTTLTLAVAGGSRLPRQNESNLVQ